MLVNVINYLSLLESDPHIKGKLIPLRIRRDIHAFQIICTLSRTNAGLPHIYSGT